MSGSRGMGRGAVAGLVAVVAVVTAVVTAAVTVAIVDEGPSRAEVADEVAGQLRAELREFVEDRVDDRLDDALPSGTSTSIVVPGDTGTSAFEDIDSLDLDGLSGETFPVEPATLTVHSDGCGVIRTEFEETPHNLTWSVKDPDGFQVLGRNAEGETRYRYFEGGTYTVVLEAWNGDFYAPVSNEVIITC